MIKPFRHASESEVVISELMLPSHSNFGGKIHGGYILSLMDQIAFACASKHSSNYCVTASVEKVNFLQPIEVGEMVTMKARINHVGTSSMVVGIRVESENIIEGFVKHCNSSFFTMVAKDKIGQVVKVPGLILKSHNEVRRFLRSVERKESQKTRKSVFDDRDFDSSKYLDELKDYNVQIDI